MARADGRHRGPSPCAHPPRRRPGRSHRPRCIGTAPGRISGRDVPGNTGPTSARRRGRSLFRRSDRRHGPEEPELRARSPANEPGRSAVRVPASASRFSRPSATTSLAGRSLMISRSSVLAGSRHETPRFSRGRARLHFQEFARWTTPGRSNLRSSSGGTETSLQVSPWMPTAFPSAAVPRAIRLEDNRVSRSHAAIERRADGSFVLIDLASRGGTQLNGRQLTPNEPAPLSDMSRISLVDYELVFHQPVSESRKRPNIVETEREMGRKISSRF